MCWIVIIHQMAGKYGKFNTLEKEHVKLYNSFSYWHYKA